ncbi:hypothetical protein [Corynebacterium jeikeium]|uniref:hypothetical protein n=1 Tax=Corynebacterium jeikeium TaxID=38289 RepID=UPI000558E656|nr:hypothetical protein [Corynebacterium jeikeium]
MLALEQCYGYKADWSQITVEKAREVIQGFERTYPGVKKLANRLQAQAEANGCIDTVTVNVLHVNKDRAYAAQMPGSNFRVVADAKDLNPLSVNDFKCIA